MPSLDVALRDYLTDIHNSYQGINREGDVYYQMLHWGTDIPLIPHIYPRLSQVLYTEH